MRNRYKCVVLKNQICIQDTFENELYSDIDFDELRYLSQFSSDRFQHDLSILKKVVSGEIQPNTEYNSRIYHNSKVENIMVKENTDTVHTSSIIEKTKIRGSLPKTVVINGVGSHTCQLWFLLKSSTKTTVNISIDDVLRDLYVYAEDKIKLSLSVKDLAKVNKSVIFGENVIIRVAELDNNQPLPKVPVHLFGVCLHIDCAKFDMVNFISVHEGLKMNGTVHLNPELYNISEWFDYVIDKHKKGTWEQNFGIADDGKILKWLLEQERVEAFACTYEVQNRLLELTESKRNIKNYLSEIQNNRVAIKYKNKLLVIEFDINDYLDRCYASVYELK